MADAAIAALNSFLRGSSIEDHDEALQLANAAVKGAKGTELEAAQHAKVVALLKLDRFDDALRTIAGAGTALEQRCAFEKAYALYKTGALAEAEKTLEQASSLLQKQEGGSEDGGSSSNSSRGIRHVAAQVAYRAEKFERAAAIYSDLASSVEESGHRGEENDLRINVLATYAQLEWAGEGDAVPAGKKQPGREELEAFETTYNAACGCLARGDYGKAAMLLKRAKDLCQASEELSDEEKAVELVPIVVQQAYVSARLGKSDEAAKLQRSVVLSEISDTETKAVAFNNSLLLDPNGRNPSSNPFITQRLAESAPSVSGNDKLFEYQASVLKRNKYIIALQAQKFDGVASTSTNIITKSSASPISADRTGFGVLNAAAVSHLQDGKEALRRILPLLDSRPDDVGLLLTIIQLYIQTKNPGPALSLLDAFFKRLEAATTPDHADVRYAPGLIALAVSLYKLHGRHSAVRKELADAAAHWQKSSSAAASSLLREAGIELLRSSKPSDLANAGAAFERLVAAQPGDKAAEAGLVASLATSDFDRVQPHLKKLTPVEKLTAGIDVAALLSAGVANLPPPPAASSGSKKRPLDDPAAQDGSGKAAQPASKRRRKRKLPKNYEEGKTPDPERWLPLRDRSSYRPKGRKGKKRAAEATQGGPVKEEAGETLELVGGAGAVRVEKASVVVGSGGGPGGGKKKKGKGKK